MDREEKIPVEEKILVLGALLHDVGKAIQRSKGMGKKHEEYSEEFVRNYLDDLDAHREIKERVMYIVRKHHAEDSDDSLLQIVKEADRLSARFDREKYKGQDSQDVATTPLLSIFSEIVLSEENALKMYNSVIPLQENLKNHFPVDKAKAKVDYHNVMDTLQKNWDKLRELPTFVDRVNTINYIFLKAFKFVPSAVYEAVPDIPLYDHLKTTAAIALCLYRSDNKDKPFLLIGGEISGIQKFLFYNLKAEEADRGAAKRFRGRSFMINLITDSVVKYIVTRLNLYEFSVLVNAAGHFIILAPNTLENKKELENLIKDVSKYIYRNFPRMYFAISWMECSRKDIENFDTTLKTFYEEYLPQRKFRKFSEIISEEELEEEFFEEKTNITPCPACGKDSKSETEVCNTCQTIEKIGGKLVRARYLARKTGKDINSDWIFEYGKTSISYRIVTDGEDISKFKDWEIFSLRNFELPEHGVLRGFKTYGSFAPSISVEDLGYQPSSEEDVKRILSFSEIVQAREKIEDRLGEIQEKSPKLAMLKMDVDNLGAIFARGIERMSVSRYSHLSFMLDIFFALESVAIAKKHNVYLLFAGGDDLTAIGRYDEIISFALEIHEKFVRWCAGNPNLTLSSGIAMADHKFPIRRLVEYADESLKLAKEEGKNRIGIFGLALRWDDFKKQIEIAEKLQNYHKDGRISGVFSHLLLNIYSKSKHTKGYTKEIVHPRPYISYYLKRNFKAKDEMEREELLKEIMDAFPHIKVGASIWALNKRYNLSI